MRGNKRSKIIAFILAAAMAFSAAPVYAAAAEDGSAGLTIIHVNDRHGRTNLEPYISRLAKELKAEGENVLILDAGDSVHGQTPANLSKGATMVQIMNAVGYDAMAPGNHDFNFGVDRLLEISGETKFPILAANVKKDGQRLFEPYKVFQLEGIKVGVFGLATPETVTKSDPRIVAGIDFENPAKAAEEMVEALKAENCDIIVALVHLGLDGSTKAEERSDTVAAVEGIDIVIDGHSHTKLENGKLVGETLIAQTGSYAENIGIVEVKLEQDGMTKTARLLAAPTEENPNPELSADEEIVAAIEREDKAIEPITSQIVGHTPVLLQGEREFVRVGETNLTDLISDSMRFATGADIAFLTGGNIRASIEQGDITMGQLLTTLPFANLLATVELTGAEMMEALEHGVSNYPEPAGSHIQVSGIRFVFDEDAPPMSRVTKVEMADGTPLEMDKTYTVATIDFITAGGDGYEVMAKAKNKMYYQGDVEALVAYLDTKPEITEGNDGRQLKVKSDEFAAPELVEAVEPSKAPEPVAAPAPAAVSEATEAAPAASGGVYVVQPGDNLTKIANEYGTTWRELHKLNSQIQNPNLIFPGQEIVLPEAS